jgi:hypothetical protein
MTENNFMFTPQQIPSEVNTRESEGVYILRRKYVEINLI